MNYDNLRAAGIAWLRVHAKSLRGQHEDIVQDAFLNCLNAGNADPTVSYFVQCVKNRSLNILKSAHFRKCEPAANFFEKKKDR